MLQIKAKIISNKKIKGSFRHCVLDAAGIAKEALPGQFITIRIEDGELLLRRPFGVHSVKGSRLEILYEVLGKGTKFLSQRKPGEHLDVIGPLGNGFDYGTPRHQDTRTHVLVAGGMGVAPLIFLAEKLAEVKSKKAKVKNIVLIGAKTKNHILCEKEFKGAGFDVKIATDDGSRGYKGYVSELLERELYTVHRTPYTIYACGPRPMLKEVCRASSRYGLPSQVSLEEHMACGTGVCFGCVVGTKQGYKRVCKEGPVFMAKDLIW